MNQDGAPPVDHKLNIVWIVNAPSDFNQQHGGSLRYINLARELSRRGNTVHFLVPAKLIGDEAQEVLRRLIECRIIASFTAIEPFVCPKWAGRFADLLVHPRITYRLFRRGFNETVVRILEFAKRCKADCIIVSKRDFLYALPELNQSVCTIVDWCDSLTLQAVRSLRVSGPNTRRRISLIRWALDSAKFEFLLGGRASADVFVSPIDCAYVARRRKGRYAVVPNGVALSDCIGQVERRPERLIFTGVMSFAPNIEGARWFIANVYPRVRAARPDTTFVLAGKDPPEALRSMAGNGVTVTGFVDNLQRAIAESSLYVAPLISGSGFRNKIMEALASGTFVAATRLAVESFPQDLQKKLLVSDTPGQMADHILYFLDHPGEFEDRLREAREIVHRRFTWAQSALALEALAVEVSRGRRASVPDGCLGSDSDRIRPRGVHS